MFKAPEEAELADTWDEITKGTWWATRPESRGSFSSVPNGSPDTRNIGGPSRSEESDKVGHCSFDTSGTVCAVGLCNQLCWNFLNQCGEREWWHSGP